MSDGSQKEIELSPWAEDQNLRVTAEVLTPGDMPAKIEAV